MATPIRINLELAFARPLGAVLSLESFARCALSLGYTPDEIGQHVDRALANLRVERCDDAVDLIGGEVVDATTLRADKISLRIEPDDGYRVFVSAIAANNSDRFRLDFRHGWPVLSPVEPLSAADSSKGAVCEPDAGESSGIPVSNQSPARVVDPSSGAGNLGGDAHPPLSGVAPAFVEISRLITEQQ